MLIKEGSVQKQSVKEQLGRAGLDRTIYHAKLQCHIYFIKNNGRKNKNKYLFALPCPLYRMFNVLLISVEIFYVLTYTHAKVYCNELTNKEIFM